MTLEQLKEERKDLVQAFELMTKEQLLEQIYLECLDAINMRDRVEVFMEECTDNMSYTTYTPQVLRELISDKKEKDIKMFCADLLEDYEEYEIISKIMELARG